MLISVLVLGTLLIVSIWIESGRKLVAVDKHGSFLVAAAVGCIAMQAIHFSEEWATGFYLRFPLLFGLEPMPESFFVAFNLTWIVIWTVAASLLWRGRAGLLFTLRFLGLAAILNLGFHPLAAVATGGYFPGLYTSFFVGAAGILLTRRLAIATVPR